MLLAMQGKHNTYDNFLGELLGDVVKVECVSEVYDTFLQLKPILHTTLEYNNQSSESPRTKTTGVPSHS